MSPGGPTGPQVSSAVGGPTSGRIIGVLIAEREPLLSRGLRLLLDAEEGIEVIGEATDRAQLAECVRARTPDVALLADDIESEGPARTCEELEALAPGVAILVLTGDEHASDASGNEVAGLGTVRAAGHLRKDAPIALLAERVRLAARPGER